MSVQAITLHLPATTYKLTKRDSEQRQRPVNDVLSDAITAVAPVIYTAPQSLRSALAQIAHLNDAALWQMARTTMHPEQAARLEALHHKQQRTGLTADERAEEDVLLTLYRETILIRAQAAVLLQQRGYDVSDPTQFAPL